MDGPHEDGVDTSRAQAAAQKVDAIARAKQAYIASPSSNLTAIALSTGVNVHELAERARLEGWERARDLEQNRVQEEVRKRSAEELVGLGMTGLRDLIKSIRPAREAVIHRLLLDLAPDAKPAPDNEENIIEQPSVMKLKNGDEVIVKTRRVVRTRALARDAKIAGRILELEANLYVALVGGAMAGPGGGKSPEQFVEALQAAAEAIERSTVGGGAPSTPEN